jgi:hypothetical protein
MHDLRSVHIDQYVCRAQHGLEGLRCTKSVNHPIVFGQDFRMSPEKNLIRNPVPAFSELDAVKVVQRQSGDPSNLSAER